MTTPTFPFPISEPILDLTFLLNHPLGQAIGLFLITFIPTFLILWLLSNLFNFKKQDYKTPLFIALIISSTSFIIRSINLMFSLANAQEIMVSRIAIIAEVFLLWFLIKKSYNLKWFKSIFTLIITYLGRGMIFGGITLIILLFFSTIPQDIEEERIGDKIKIGSFETIKIDNHTFNFKSNISFVTKTENVTLTSLHCMTQSNSLFPDIEDHLIEYKFESFDYRNLDLKVKGLAHFECSSACASNNALMNTGSAKGTEIIFIEGGENIILNLDFIVMGGENKIVECTPIINSKNPEFTTKWYAKLFEINYVAD